MSNRLMFIPATTLLALTLAVLLLVGLETKPLANPAPAPAPAGERDLYNPARTALVNAQLQLAESSKLQQEILERNQKLQKELESALTLLTNAEQEDPEMKSAIEAVRQRIVALQQSPLPDPKEDERTLELYAECLQNLQTLIDHY